MSASAPVRVATPSPSHATAGRGLAAAARTLWRFGRPHTLVGTTLAVATLALIATRAAGVALGAPATLRTVALAWLATMAANLYVVGLNQLCDEPIDRVNKPELPLPAGLIERGPARRVVLAAGGVAVLVALAAGPWLAGTVAFAIAVGTTYSVPPWRWKRRAVPAALSVAAVRGLALHLGVHAHLASELAVPLRPPPAVWILALFTTLFALAIAVAKDVADVPGDRRFAIRSLAAEAGSRVAVRATLALVALAYAAAGLAALLLLPRPLGAAGLATHAALLLLAARAALRLAPHERPAVARWYRGLWWLFYVEYGLVALLAVAGGT